MRFSTHISRTGKPARSRRAAAAAITGVMAWATLGSYAQAPPNKISYDSFRMVRSRNIFDPDRSRDLVLASSSSSSRFANGSQGGTPTPAIHAAATDYVMLTGILMTEDQTLAFFAGSQPDYNKVIALNGSIAGATITKITSSSIDVLRNGKAITVAVGQTVPFDNNSAPGLPPAPPATAAVPEAAGAATPVLDPQAVSAQVPLPAVTGGTPASPPPPSDVSDAMRRMMERRQKELNP
jgi:hypothetical protein